MIHPLEVDDIAYFVSKTDPASQSYRTLVEEMVATSPAAAVVKMSQISNFPGERRRQLLWASHWVDEVRWRVADEFVQPGDVESAISELQKLSRADEWWLRLYVAVISERCIPLRRPEILERLLTDSDETVRLRAKIVRAGPSQQPTDDSDLLDR